MTGSKKSKICLVNKQKHASNMLDTGHVTVFDQFSRSIGGQILRVGCHFWTDFCSSALSKRIREKQ